MDRLALFPIINQGFSVSELKELCFQLQLDYDSIGTGPKRQWVIELIGYFERRGELDRLERTCRMLRPILFPSTAQPAQYKSSISFPLELLHEAERAISSLTSESIQRELAITRPLSHGGWMGANSNTVITILYNLYKPILTYRLVRNEIERNFSLLDWRSRLKFQLLEFAMQTVLHDSKIASVPPKIEYTPRVPGWRQKREMQPSKFWWQGLSEDRLDKAVEAFCGIDIDGKKRLLTAAEFHQYYRDVFLSSDEKAQQAIGLAANPLYGFSIATRPVYWRVLVIQSILYWTIMYIQDESLKQPATDIDILNIVKTAMQRDFPMNTINVTANAYETQDITLHVAMEFIRVIVVPNVFLKLSASQYEEPPSAQLITI